jgi:hypothetical protein
MVKEQNSGFKKYEKIVTRKKFNFKGVVRQDTSNGRWEYLVPIGVAHAAQITRNMSTAIAR